MNYFNAFILILIVPLIVFSCGNDADRERDPGEAVPEAGAPDILVPYTIDAEGVPGFRQDQLRFRDYSNVLNAISVIATVSRDSEYGNEAYRPELYPDAMMERAEQWLSMVVQIDDYFNEEGRITPWLEESAGVYEASGELDLSLYPHLVYAYHIHHRSGRFEDNEVLYNRLNREPTNYLVTPGRYIMNEHYRDGAFYDDSGVMDHQSMSYALGALHANAYAWVAWKKPGGADDMGVLSEQALGHHMGHTPNDMVAIYRGAAAVLDDAWDSDRSVYDFGDGTEWDLDAAGAMIRGKKAMYDFLYMFGDEDDAELSRTIFDRTVAMLEAIAPLAEPWGLPERISFTPDGTRPASGTVSLYDWYQFLNHLGGGYALDREREGTSMYLTEHRSDVFDLIGEISDEALLGAMEYHLIDGRLVTELDFSDGSVTDDRLTVSTAAMFITMAGNMYRKGDAFERASDWDSVSEEISGRSKELFDISFDHLELLDNAF